MSQTVNQITLSGEVAHVFDKRLTKNGMNNAAFRMSFKENERDNGVVVNVYGSKADDLNLSVGDQVLVAGRLTEQRWQDKDTQNWLARHDVVANQVVNVSELVNPEEDDDPLAD